MIKPLRECKKLFVSFVFFFFYFSIVKVSAFTGCGSSSWCVHTCSEGGSCSYNPATDQTTYRTVVSCTPRYCPEGFWGFQRSYKTCIYDGNSCSGGGGYTPPACETNSTFDLKVTVKRAEDIINTCHIGEEDYDLTSLGSLNLSKDELIKNNWWSRYMGADEVFGGAYGGDDSETTPIGNINLGWNPKSGLAWVTAGASSSSDMEQTIIGSKAFGWTESPGWKEISLNTTSITQMVGAYPAFENNGFLLKNQGDPLGAHNLYTFFSKEGTNIPKITITYTTPSDPTPKTIELNTIADNSIVSDGSRGSTLYPHSNTNYGALNTISTGSGDIAGGIARTLIKFDFSSIPSDATITSTILKLYLYYRDTNPNTVQVYRLKQPWVEMGSTWITYSNINWRTISLNTSSISSMIGDSPSFENNGFLLKCSGEAMNNSLYYSREYTDTALRPKLTVVYSTPSNPSDTSAVLNPTADTSISAGAMVEGTDWERQGSTINYGNSTNLSIGEMKPFYPPGGGNPSRGLIQFDLSEIPSGSTIKSAKLSLYLYGSMNISYTQPCDLGAYRMKRPWMENYATWNVHGYNWRTVNLDTSAVKAMLGGSPSFTNNGFVVKSDLEKSDLFEYYSREHGSTSEVSPKLKLTYSTSGSNEAAVTLSPSADTYILSSNSTTNYGGSGSLIIGHGIVSDYIAKGRGLIKYNLSSIPSNADVTNAELSLYLYDGQASKDSTLKVYRVRRDWVENQATWKVYNTGNLWWCADSYGWTCGEREAVVPESKVYAYAMTGGDLGIELKNSGSATDSNGTITFKDIGTSYKEFALSAKKIQEPDSLDLACPESASGYTRVNLGTVDYCTTKNVILGINSGGSYGPITEELPWLSVVDGDIFASSAVDVAVPSGTATGFFNLSLINTKYPIQSGSSTGLGGGYVFTQGYVTTGNDRLYPPESGGFIFDISSAFPAISHNDVSLIRLAKRSFGPPTHDEVVELTDIDTFEAGKVYKISVSDFNSKISSGPVTYTISPSSDVNLASLGVSTAILYITGTDDIEFKNEYLSSNFFARIIIVTDAKVVISKDVGFSNIALYSVFASPLIQAGIISSKEIEIESKGSTEIDIPITLSSPLISVSEIKSNRDLGAYNDYFPSLSVEYYPKFLYDLAIIERLQSYNGSRSYTGIHTYDLQFDYQY